MARKRYISTDISLSGKIEELARRCGEYAALLFTWMVPHADDWGRMEGDADKVFFTVTPRFALLGRTPDDAEQALEVMDDIGLLQRYEVDGRRYVQLNLDTFYELQTYIPREKREQDKSCFPPPPGRMPGAAAQSSTECNSAAQSSTESQQVAQNAPSPSPSPSTPSPSVPPQSPPEGEGGGASTQSNGSTIDEVLNRYPRYTNEQWTTIRDYWNLIRFTRKTGRVAANIVAREMDYWERFDPAIVVEALSIHIRKYQTKQEDYTRGIMRRLARERSMGHDSDGDGSDGTDLGSGRGAAKRPTARDYTSGRYGRFFAAVEDAEAGTDP